MSETPRPTDLSEEDFGIKILKNGTWLHQGAPMTRHNLVKLFSTVLRRDENGDFWLQTPVERGRITVEDAPFIATALRREGEGTAQNLYFETNIGDWLRLDAEHPLIIRPAADTGQMTPYIYVRNGLEARLAHSVYYELAELAVASADHADLYGVYSGGIFFALEAAQGMIQE